MTQSVNHKGVCKTTPATPGLLNIFQLFEDILDLSDCKLFEVVGQEQFTPWKVSKIFKRP